MEAILRQYIMNSYELLQGYDEKGRYFHTLTPKDNSPVVVHKKTNQLTYILSGEGTIVLNDEEKKIKTGSCIFVEAGMTHQFMAVSDELTLFHIHIPDEGRDNDRFVVKGEDYARYK